MIAALALAAAFSGQPMALPDCLGKPRVRPTEVVLACADANFGVRKLRWTGWGQSFAAATGVGYANDCTPNCAAGHMHTYQAVIVASGTQRCPGGVTAYSRVAVAFVGRSPYPKSSAADMTYPARCR
ncbi:MAG TPA: hypothetical protein VF327_13885 [Gaiellaceae bacterium]